MGPSTCLELELRWTLRSRDGGGWIPRVTDSPGKRLLLFDEGCLLHSVWGSEGTCEWWMKEEAAWYRGLEIHMEAVPLEAHRLRLPAETCGQWRPAFGT